MNQDQIQEIFRPTGVVWGRMQADPKLCDGCGFCAEICPRKCWKIGEDDLAAFNPERGCTSCHNCTVVCASSAIKPVVRYHVTGGFFRTETPLPKAQLPEEPRNAQGGPDRFTKVERVVMERRSVRSFKPDPVPEPLLRRVLEAGRFAPSGVNSQPWRFMVIIDQAMLDDFAVAIRSEMKKIKTAYSNDQALPLLAQQLESSSSPGPGIFDPRFVGSIGNVVEGRLPVFLGAPTLILILVDERAPSGVFANSGIAGQNMCLVANSLGLGTCWSGLSYFINMIPELKNRINLQPPWKVGFGMLTGYPSFQQNGMVPRDKRLVTWFRPGKTQPSEE